MTYYKGETEYGRALRTTLILLLTIVTLITVYRMGCATKSATIGHRRVPPGLHCDPGYAIADAGGRVQCAEVQPVMP